MPTGNTQIENPPATPEACAACGASLAGLSADLAACPDCGHARGAPRPRFCKGCGYDLAGIESHPAVCPECGRDFDPDDPETTTTLTRTTLFGEARQRYALPLAVFLLIVTGFVYKILPRPAELSDWRLWVWLDSENKFGVETTWLSGSPGRRSWWAGRITSVRAFERSGAPLWEVNWQWPDHWTVRAHRAGVDRSELSQAFTEMKREMFGVLIGTAVMDRTDGPLELAGDKIEVFSGMVRYFGIEVSPFLLHRNQRYVWLFDRELGKMIAVDRAKAASMGYELRLWRGGDRPEKLIEPPAGGSPSFEQSRGADSQ